MIEIQDPRTGLAFESEADYVDYITEQLRYGWRESHDATRYCDYEKVKPILEREQPGIARAIQNYEAAIEALDAIFR